MKPVERGSTLYAKLQLKAREALAASKQRACTLRCPTLLPFLLLLLADVVAAAVLLFSAVLLPLL